MFYFHFFFVFAFETSHHLVLKSKYLKLKALASQTRISKTESEDKNGVYPKINKKYKKKWEV